MILCLSQTLSHQVTSIPGTFLNYEEAAVRLAVSFSHCSFRLAPNLKRKFARASWIQGKQMHALQLSVFFREAGGRYQIELDLIAKLFLRSMLRLFLSLNTNFRKILFSWGKGLLCHSRDTAPLRGFGLNVSQTVAAEVTFSLSKLIWTLIFSQNCLSFCENHWVFTKIIEI